MLRESSLEGARKTLEEAGYTVPSGFLPFDVGQPTERGVFRMTKIEGHDHVTVEVVLVSEFLEDVWKGRETHAVDGR